MRQSLPTCSISIFLKPLQLWKNIRAREALKAISSDNYCYANSPTLLPSNSSKRKVAGSLTPSLMKKTFWKLLRKYTPWGPVLAPFWESSSCPWQWWRVMIAQLWVYTTRSFRSKDLWAFPIDYTWARQQTGSLWDYCFPTVIRINQRNLTLYRGLL